MKRHPFAVPFLVVALGLSASRSLQAKSQFPREVQMELSLVYTPPCSLCHKNGATGPGTVKTPFGLSAIARGLDASDRNSLGLALRQMQSDRVDSDADGVSDIDELKVGTDPNTAASTSPADYPAGGCGASPREGGGGTAPAAAFLASPLAFSLRRRRRRGPSSP